MSRSAARRERRAAKAAHIAAGTWQPKPPVGRCKLVYRVAAGLAPAMASDMARGRSRAKKIHDISIAPPAKGSRVAPARDAVDLIFQD